MLFASTTLEEQLMEVGYRILCPPSSADELLPLLNRIENCLSWVEQAPSKSTQDALIPMLKALVQEQLLKHSHVDVKVAIASCISEILRITAPDLPCDDNQMKEILQLIVSSFENLSHYFSRSYKKRISILETFANVKLCLVMLDLECKALILEMFQHFLNATRTFQPNTIFTPIETIMTTVFEESDDISLELLFPILACVKKDNTEVLPIAQKLGAKVLENCASKLKPYLIQAVTTLGFSSDDYCEVVASICHEASSTIEENVLDVSSEKLVDETILAVVSCYEEIPVTKAAPTEMVFHEVTIDLDSLLISDKPMNEDLKPPLKAIDSIKLTRLHGYIH